MADEIEELFAKKLSKNDKRGNVRNSQDLHNDQRVLDAPAVRPAAQLRDVQRKLAVLAVEHPGLATDAQRQLWLEEVLEAMGLRRRIQTPSRQPDLPCFPYTGSMRGYNLHLRGYTAACTECKNVAVAAELARLRTLGIREDSLCKIQ